jgi:hypothetical protein
MSVIHELPIQLRRNLVLATDICCFCIAHIDVKKYHIPLSFDWHFKIRKFRTSKCHSTTIAFGQLAYQGPEIGCVPKYSAMLTVKIVQWVKNSSKKPVSALFGVFCALKSIGTLRFGGWLWA